jgi:hypothetical protein
MAAFVITMDFNFLTLARTAEHLFNNCQWVHIGSTSICLILVIQIAKDLDI